MFLTSKSTVQIQDGKGSLRSVRVLSSLFNKVVKKGHAIFDEKGRTIVPSKGNLLEASEQIRKGKKVLARAA